MLWTQLLQDSDSLGTGLDTPSQSNEGDLTETQRKKALQSFFHYISPPQRETLNNTSVKDTSCRKSPGLCYWIVPHMLFLCVCVFSTSETFQQHLLSSLHPLSSTPILAHLRFCISDCSLKTSTDFTRVFHSFVVDNVSHCPSTLTFHYGFERFFSDWMHQMENE